MPIFGPLRPPIERHRLRSVWYGKPRTFLPVPIKGKEALVFGYRTYMRGPLPDDLEYALAYGNDKSVFELTHEAMERSRNRARCSIRSSTRTQENQYSE